jgi:hypothetical protein
VQELQKRPRSEQNKLDRIQAKIRRVQDGCEAAPPVCTAAETEERIKGYGHVVAVGEMEVKRLQEMMEQQSIDKETKEAARRTLEAIRDANLANASFAAKRDVVAKLEIRVPCFRGREGCGRCVETRLRHWI